MHFVTEHAKHYNMSPVLTFDQPLYWKGVEIQQCEDDMSPFKDIVFQLGGLHTSMSVLRSIGHRMTSQELQSMLETVYAENTVPYMLSGEAISRAVRGHLSVVAALHAIIMSEIYNCPITVDSEEESSEPPELFNLADSLDLLQIADILDRSISGEVSAEDLEREEVFGKLIEKINSYKENLASSRAAKLWVQYIEMVEILCKFIKAERTGDFSLHLQAINDMLPFFAASGHMQSPSTYIFKQCPVYRKHTQIFIESFRKAFMLRVEVIDFGRDCQQTLLLSKFL